VPLYPPSLGPACIARARRLEGDGTGEDGGWIEHARGNGGKVSEGVGNDFVGGAFSQLLLSRPCCSSCPCVFACVGVCVRMEEGNGVFISVYVCGGIVCACVRRRQAPPAVPGAPLPCPAPRIICPSDPS